MIKSEQVNELASALAKAQSEIVNARKDAQNPYFKSDYSTISSVWDACRGPLTKNGLSVVQTVEHEADGSYLHSALLHSSGQFIEARMKLIVIKQDMQSLGSAITYARRYSLMALIGISPEDDDGNSASQRDNSDKEQYAKPPPIPQKETPNISIHTHTDPLKVNDDSYHFMVRSGSLEGQLIGEIEPGILVQKIKEAKAFLATGKSSEQVRNFLDHAQNYLTQSGYDEEEIEPLVIDPKGPKASAALVAKLIKAYQAKGVEAHKLNEVLDKEFNEGFPSLTEQTAKLMLERLK